MLDLNKKRLSVDKYQQRYLDHQAKKKAQLSPKTIFGPPNYSKEADTLMRLMMTRHSQRVYNGNMIATDEMDYIYKAIELAPSSCNRKGVSFLEITDREDKEILSGLLVGGVGWSYRADRLILLVADMEAYKSPAERNFMPFLDAGVLIQQIYLACEAKNIGCAYINPNIRKQNKELMKRFTDKLFCGAMALGKY